MEKFANWLNDNFDSEILLFFAIFIILIFAFGSLSLVAIALFVLFATAAFKILAICTGFVAIVATIVLIFGTAIKLLE